MLSQRNKISLRQSLLIIVALTYSPAIRLLPVFAARNAGQAGWLATIPGYAVVLILLWLLAPIFKAHPGASLAEIFERVLGKIVGKLVLGVYAIWIYTLMLLYVRYHMERMLSTIMPHTSMSIFCFLLLVVVFLALRAGLPVLGRMSELLLNYILIPSFLVLCMVLIPLVRWDNLTPISMTDVIPILKASTWIASIGGYFLFLFFLGDEINDKENIRRQGFQAVGLTMFLATVLLIVTIGVLGAGLTERLPTPFSNAVKVISIGGFVERLDSVVVASWGLSDFVLVTAMGFITLHLLKVILGLKEPRRLVFPLAFLTFWGSLAFTSNRFDMESFSLHFTWVNLALQYAVFPLVFVIGKLRRVF